MQTLIRLLEGGVVMTIRTTSHLHRAGERHRIEQRTTARSKSNHENLCPLISLQTASVSRTKRASRQRPGAQTQVHGRPLYRSYDGKRAAEARTRSDSHPKRDITHNHHFEETTSGTISSRASRRIIHSRRSHVRTNDILTLDLQRCFCGTPYFGN